MLAPKAKHTDFTLQFAWADIEITSDATSATVVWCGQGRHIQQTSALGGIGLLVSLS